MTQTSFGLRPAAAPLVVIRRLFADDGSGSYFHQYEIVVTFFWTWQAIFMNMKRAEIGHADTSPTGRGGEKAGR